VTRAPESGLIAYATLLAIHRIAVDPDQLRHELGHHDDVRSEEILRLAKRQDGVRARAVKADWAKLARLPLPAIADGPDGWFLLGRVNGEEALIQRPGEPPSKLSREQLEAIWSGLVLLVTTREGVAGALGKFDVRWFIPQIVRYRRLIGEVLLITLAINLLGLASPLFFQNIIDKVLVHNTLATLQVLAIGFLAVSIWEVLFGWLRTRT
jgi:subfamily B ATP-binding cassette protein HlyB/CyaB